MDLVNRLVDLRPTSYDVPLSPPPLFPPSAAVRFFPLPQILKSPSEKRFPLNRRQGIFFFLTKDKFSLFFSLPPLEPHEYFPLSIFLTLSKSLRLPPPHYTSKSTHPPSPPAKQITLLPSTSFFFFSPLGNRMTKPSVSLPFFFPL